jgi:hypothetical protein
MSLGIQVHPGILLVYPAHVSRMYIFPDVQIDYYNTSVYAINFYFVVAESYPR